MAQLPGVHVFTLGAPITLHLSPAQVYVFDARGDLLRRAAAKPVDGTTDMARIDLDLAHAYRPNPQRDEDYALLPLKMSFEDGGAYALLGPSGCGKTTLLNIVSGPGHAVAGQRAATTAATSPGSARSSATSRRCSSSRSSTTR